MDSTTFDSFRESVGRSLKDALGGGEVVWADIKVRWVDGEGVLNSVRLFVVDPFWALLTLSQRLQCKATMCVQLCSRSRSTSSR
jgi:hypothetical protein